MTALFESYQNFDEWVNKNIWNPNYEDPEEHPLEKKDWDTAKKKREEAIEYKLCEIVLWGGFNLIVSICYFLIIYTNKLIKLIFCPVILKRKRPISK